MAIEVSRVLDAAPADVFAFLARPANHVLFDTSGMVVGSADPDATVTGTGQVFVMDMNRTGPGDYQVANHVVVFEPDRAIGWAPSAPGQEPAGHTWVWRLAPDGPDRTRVTQVYDWSEFSHLDMLKHLPVVGEDGLRASLDKLAAALPG